MALAVATLVCARTEINLVTMVSAALCDRHLKLVQSRRAGAATTAEAKVRAEVMRLNFMFAVVECG